MAKNLKSIDLKKDFAHINDNHEYLKGNSAKNKKSAEEVLAIAKQQEAEKLKSGFHFVPGANRSFILRK